MALSQGAASALSSLVLVLLTAGTLGLSTLAFGGTDATAAQALAGALRTAVVAWPFAFGIHYLATRRVGVSPTPLIDALLGRGSKALSALGISVGIVWSAPVAILGIVVAIVLAPEINDPSGAPFSGMTDGQTAIANLGILVEEFLFRFVILFPLIALLGVHGVSRRGAPPLRVWAAIVVAGVLFGAAHQGMAAALGADELDYLVFAIVQKGLVAGVAFGYLAWRWGLEAAIASHYTHNILLVLISRWLGG